jgi:isochorismate synthase
MSRAAAGGAEFPGSIRVEGRPLGPAYDLLAAFDGPHGFFMERSGLGVASGAAAVRVVVAPGERQVARAAVQVRATLARATGGGSGRPAPIAVGSFPFDGTRSAMLVIPRRAVTRLAPGETWERLTGPSDAGVRREGAAPEPPGPVAGRAVPHPAFTELQLRPLPDPRAYGSAVAVAVERIRAEELRKVVLARAIDVDADRVLDPATLLHRLRAADPDAFAFAVPAGPEAVLVGATPELLVSRRGLEVASTPLAGSAPRSGDRDEDRANADRLVASGKEREEHAIVVESVAQALGPFCDELRSDPEPAPMATANVWHLATRFRGRLREPAADALELVAALHPTPAVCGSPARAARALIAELEPFDRGGYAGPVGWMDAAGDGDWAIALRCAELSGPSARLFAGAGIVSGSDPSAEVEETERKFRSLLDSLRWG